MASINELRGLLVNSKGTSGWIPRNIRDPQWISPTRKQDAIEAIAWLLSKTPHSVEEIADHFGLSSELAEQLIEEMIKNDLVLQVIGWPVRYKAERLE